jgi:plasmid stability protein
MPTTPIDRVTALLAAAGYRLLSMPLTIGSVPFDFSAALLGPDRAPDLVLVIDTIEEKEVRVRQKITALSRALDVIGSRRPLTAILAGPRLQRSTIEALGRVCRVLPVGTPVGKSDDAKLHDSLAVLLPLQLPEPSQAIADPLAELTLHIPRNIDHTVWHAVLAHAAQGKESIEDALRQVLTEALPKELEDGR